MKSFFIADAPQYENQSITTYFALASISARDKKGGGGQYLVLTLADKTGTLDGRMWEEFEDGLRTCQPGSYVKVQGQITKYNGKFQITLQKLRLAAESEVETADFLPHTQYDIAEMWQELRATVDSFTNPHLQRLVNAFLDDPTIGPAFMSAPAAKVLHHAWIGGLLEHVVFLLRMCKRVAPQYPEVDPDLLCTTAILHDIGKTRELEWKSSFGYSAEGQMIGHISIAMGMLRDKLAQVSQVEPFPDRLRILVEHMILSHHGSLEFGSPKLPMFAEALVFHAIDDLEAKMQNLRTQLANHVANGARPDSVTEWIRSMDRQLVDSRAYLREE
ncbi:3'-5' exoribonuclease YhaM family protein [Terriglobus tenax]|uniref:3'-5' exoribonuclease YhaM family protein n=1 Tax=Terriglobus tenax TaxID=1111115 RepID=UPI0021E06B59|nr:HD domain-containing protein [Terriglobus tenax]